MTRIAGTFVLLAGLSGCVTFTTPAQGDKKIGDGKSVMPPASMIAPAPTMPNAGAMPYAAWTADPRHTVAKPTQMPESLAMAPLLPSPTPDLRPVPSRTALPGLPAGMPMASTPMKSESSPKAETPLKPEPVRETADENIRQAAFAAVESKGGPRLPEIVTGNPATAIPKPPAPSVKNSPQAEAPKAPAAASPSGNGPLFRMVNTKRITLNFEVKDVGTSGLAGVDLWYTQDGKDWKKQETTATPKGNQVVEVDEEGMYGFTLVARSGIGLGKEPPAPGDQPQVWVIVDLTKPDAELSEAKVICKGKQQHVSFKWTATDKNLGRQPVTLSWSEKPEGPWQVIAANQDAAGEYKWEVPNGTPPRVLLRCEATDLAGNVGRSQLTRPLLLDNMLPKVSIVNVQSNSR